MMTRTFFYQGTDRAELGIDKMETVGWQVRQITGVDTPDFVLWAVVFEREI